jgi:hypothetical protein
MAANQSSGGSPWSSTPKAAPPGASPGAPVTGGKQRGWLRGGAAADNVLTFRSPTALVVWIVWLLFAVANWIDLAVQGRDHTSVVAAAILLLVTGIAYATAQRPRIIADDAGVTVRNPVRDHRIGWASVTKVDLADLLRVHCDWEPDAASGKKHRKVISSWAVHYSRRRQLAAEVRSRRGPTSRRSSFGLPSGRGLGYGDMVPAPARSAAASSASTAEADAEMIVRLLSERATAAQAETVWATGTVDIARPATPGARPATPGARPATPGARPADSAEAAPAVAGWLEPLRSSWSSSAIAAVLIPALILLIVCLVA